MGQAEFLRGSHTHSPKIEIQHLRSAISQIRHTTATISSRETLNLLSWTLMLYILRFFQSQWFLKKFAPREKCSRLREMRRLSWESFFAKPKTICGWPKRRLAANWDSICVPAAGQDRKSTRLNSSHVAISYAVFCLKKKKKTLD